MVIGRIQVSITGATPAGISISYMALAVHAGRGAAVLQLTNKHCKERVVTHLYLCLNARATAGRLAHHEKYTGYG
eukprot:jgi/Chrzof1/7722/Cz02g34080.t1